MHRCHRAPLGTVCLVATAILITPPAVQAAVVTWDLYNVPSVQNGRTLFGYLEIDTSQATLVTPGIYDINPNSPQVIANYFFSVSGGGASQNYAVAWDDGNTVRQITGTTGALYLIVDGESDGLYVRPGGSLTLGNTVGGSLSDSISWDRGESNNRYRSTYNQNTSPNGWSSSGDAVDNAFGGAGAWLIAGPPVPVPEPGSCALIAAAVGVTAVAGATRRRRWRAALHRARVRKATRSAISCGVSSMS